MPYVVVFDPEFERWFDVQDDPFRDLVLQKLLVLSQEGPHLGRPLVDHIKGSNHPNLKELRFRYGKQVVRILFAFDLKQQAYIALGGDKSNDPQWYARSIRLADGRITDHLAAQRAEIEAEALRLKSGKRKGKP